MKNKSYINDYEAYKASLTVCATITRMIYQNLTSLNGRVREENIHHNIQNLFLKQFHTHDQTASSI
jgi:hypothetical protein